MKKSRKRHKEAHCANTKYGMGDYYGTGIKQPVGRMRDSSYPGINPVTPRQLRKPPKSLV